MDDLIPSPAAVDKAVQALEASEYRQLESLGWMVMAVMKNDTIHRQYTNAEPAVLRALAYGIFLGRHLEDPRFLLL